MTEDELFEQTGQLYLGLIHADSELDDFRQEIVTMIALAPSVPDEVIISAILGRSFRERLLGIYFGMTRPCVAFREAMAESLRDLRGISIVPACAAFGVLARRGVFRLPEGFGEMFDRDAFDGEVGGRSIGRSDMRKGGRWSRDAVQITGRILRSMRRCWTRFMRDFVGRFRQLKIQQRHQLQRNS